MVFVSVSFFSEVTGKSAFLSQPMCNFFSLANGQGKHRLDTLMGLCINSQLKIQDHAVCIRDKVVFFFLPEKYLQYLNTMQPFLLKGTADLRWSHWNRVSFNNFLHIGTTATYSSHKNILERQGQRARETRLTKVLCVAQSPGELLLGSCSLLLR